MEFHDPKPIYLQIAEFIEESILEGKWVDKIPAIRELAVLLKVNPNTVTRTYAYLENQGIVSIQRGVGYFITEDAKSRILALQKKEFIEKTLPALTKTMKMLGLSFDDLKRRALKIIPYHTKKLPHDVFEQFQGQVHYMEDINTPTIDEWPQS